jgi:proteasome lid subunit RPN8/RPN11
VAPYPPIRFWRIPAAALRLSLDGVREAGRRGKESGALWLGRREDVSEVTIVVLPRGDGVIEAPNRWQVAPEVMGAITRWARPHGLVMLGMFHIHIGGSVAMSWSDRNRVVQVPGVLSVISGNAGSHPDDRRWGWYLYENGAYRELPLVERQRRILVVDGGTAAAWVANAEGMWEFAG